MRPVTRCWRGEIAGAVPRHATDVWGRKGLAEAVYFESEAGAKVFSAGTIRWSWGLGRPGFIQPGFVRFNENLIRTMLDRTV